MEVLEHVVNQFDSTQPEIVWSASPKKKSLILNDEPECISAQQHEAVPCQQSIGTPNNGENQDPVQIESKVNQIQQLFTENSRNRYELGKAVYELHELLAKPGSGSFVKTVEERFEFSIATAYRFMDIYSVAVGIKATDDQIDENIPAGDGEDSYSEDLKARIEEEIRKVNDARALSKHESNTTLQVRMKFANKLLRDNCKKAYRHMLECFGEERFSREFNIWVVSHV